MNCLTKKLVLALAMLAVVLLAAGCAHGSNIKNAVASSSPSISLSPPTFSTPAFSPKTRSPRPATAHATVRPTAPGQIEQARVADVLATLYAVRSAMDAEHSPSGAGGPQGARVHGLLMSFEASLAALRDPGDYPR